MHLFFECPTTHTLLKKFADKYLPPNISDSEIKRFVFLGLDLRGKKDDIMQMVGIVFLYCIWTGKIRRRPISFPTLEENMFLIFDGIADSYKWVSDMATNSDDYWSRHWRGRTGGGRG